MSQPPDLKPTAQALCDAATLPGLTPRDVDQCESSRLKFICYAIAARLHDDPSALLAALGLFLDYIAAATLGRQVLEVIGMKLETAHDAAANMARAERGLMRAMDRAVLAAEEADRG